MVTVTLTEPMLNQIGRALADQTVRDAKALREMRRQGADDFDIEVLEMAVQHTVAATLALTNAMEEPEPPDNITFEMFFRASPS